MKQVRQFFLLLSLLVGLFTIISCNHEIPINSISVNEYNERDLIVKTINDLYASRLDVTEDMIKVQLAKNLNNDEILECTASKSEPKQIAQNLLDLTEKLINLDPLSTSSKEEYIVTLIQILNNDKQSITDTEFELINVSIFIASHIIDVYLQEEFITKGWWDSWGKCAAGITGGTLGGGLAGGAAGSVLPVLGTTAGAIVGAISGGLTGAAAAC